MRDFLRFLRDRRTLALVAMEAIALGAICLLIYVKVSGVSQWIASQDISRRIALWATLTILLVTICLPYIVFILWSSIVIRRPSNIPLGHCPRCGYDMHSSPLRCSECGFEFSDDYRDDAVRYHKEKHRKAFAAFLERLAANTLEPTDWSTYAIAHYPDGELEAIRQRLVQLSIERNPSGNPEWLTADHDLFRKWAALLRADLYV